MSPAHRLKRPRRRRVCSKLLTLAGNHFGTTIWRLCSRYLRHHSISCILLSEGGLLLLNPYEPIAVDERLCPCFTLSIAQRPYMLGSRGVRVGPAHRQKSPERDSSLRSAALRACDFFGMASVRRGVEGDGEGRGAGWERVRGVLEINFSVFHRYFTNFPDFLAGIC